MLRLNPVIYIGVGCLATMVTAWAIQSQVSDSEFAAADSSPKPALLTDAGSGESVGSQAYPVTIRTPQAPSGVKTGQHDHHGNVVRLSCRSCHDIRKANTTLSSADQLDTFHQGLKFSHGQLTCAACHNAEDGYTTLHLADGSSVKYADTMTLCAQCHGPQFRDYQHGSHGGMTGYWDLTKGPRQRNHCVDCHDPHSPQFPVMVPAPGPNDRFLPSGKRAAH